jgi:hypothetical protein
MVTLFCIGCVSWLKQRNKTNSQTQHDFAATRCILFQSGKTHILIIQPEWAKNAPQNLGDKTVFRAIAYESLMGFQKVIVVR